MVSQLHHLQRIESLSALRERFHLHQKFNKFEPLTVTLQIAVELRPDTVVVFHPTILLLGRPIF